MTIRFRPVSLIIAGILLSVGVVRAAPLEPRVRVVQQAPDSVRVELTYSAPGVIRSAAHVGYQIRARGIGVPLALFNVGLTRVDTVTLARDSVDRTAWFAVRARSEPDGPWPFGDSTAAVIPARAMISAPGAPQIRVIGALLEQADSFRIWPRNVVLDAIDAQRQLAVVVWYPSAVGSVPTVCARNHDGTVGWAEVVLTDSTWSVPVGDFGWLQDDCGPIYAQILPPAPAQRSLRGL